MPRRCAVLALVLALLAAAVPAHASNEDEAAVRARLAEVAAEATAEEVELSRLDATIADEERRSATERAQLDLLARVLYEQPANPLMAVAASSNLADAVSRLTDLVGAAERARATKAALDHDLADQVIQQQRLEQVRARLSAEQQDLGAEYQRLLVLDAGASGATPAPATSFGGSMPDVIRQAWAPLGSARAEWAVRLAECESTLNPYAFNPSSGASGLFQFLPSTWAGTPWRDQSPFEPSANALAAAWLFNRSGAGQWQCSARIGYS